MVLGDDWMKGYPDPHDKRQLPAIQSKLAGHIAIIAIFIRKHIYWIEQIHAVISHFGAIVRNAHADVHTILSFAGGGEKVSVHHYPQIECHSIGADMPDFRGDIFGRRAKGEPLR